MELVIYNRWGEMVFKTNDQTNAWDGTYKGELLEPAVFIYILTVKTTEMAKPKLDKGNITLLR